MTRYADQSEHLPPLPSQPNGPLVSACTDEPEMVELIQAFVASLPATTAAIDTCLSTADFKRLAHIATELKGLAGSVGFDEISHQAVRLEAAAEAMVDWQEIARTAATEVIAVCGRATAPTSAGPGARPAEA
jgi:HPt (histidine-containing phosphotransfer) domain-containing protein